MFRPQPLLQLPCTGALRPAPALRCSLRTQWHPRALPNSEYLLRLGRIQDARLEGRALEHATSKKSGQGVRMKVNLCGPLKKEASGDFASTAGL